MDILFSLISGVVAGFAVAAPLGAIGVLLIQEGITRGLRSGISSAAAVATVDTLYCVTAVALGALAGPIVKSWSPWPQIVGGAALIAIGARGLLNARRAKGYNFGQTVSHPGIAFRRYSLFLGLTMVNPATLVFFTAILTGLDQVAKSISTAIAFIAGVGVASFGWQALLVTFGALLGRKTGPSFQRWTAAIGSGLVLVLGVVLLARILW